MQERIPFPLEIPNGMPPTNILRMWSHSTGTIRQSVALGLACMTATSLPPPFRKLLFLFCANKLGSEYLRIRHIDDAVDGHEDLSEAQIIALKLPRWELDPAIWSNKQRAFLVFVDAIKVGPVVEDGVFEGVREHFDEREIVEIITMQVRFLSIT